MNPVAELVRAERLKRGWSARRCAAESGNLISNTWWSNFENGVQPLTTTIVAAVAKAFDWDADWPNRAVSSPDDRLGAILAGLEEVSAQVDRLTKAVTRLAEAMPPPKRRAAGGSRRASGG